jgi:pimeloyl-ACP methyl ester carboxylesterase
MRPLSKILLSLLAVLVILVYVLLNPPLDVPAGALSQRIYKRGPHQVTYQPIDWTDTSRPTMANHSFKGSGSRELKGRIWFPTDKEGAPYPLVIYSHGYMSQYKEGDYILDFLASHGYVAVSVDFPLSNGSAPGGATVADIVNQPGDISFLIDQMLARSKQPDNMLHGTVDSERIAAVGLSLGGLTTELVGLDPKLRDPRIRAAISMAGPSEFFTPDFFAGDDIPFMYVGGTADAIVPYKEHAEPLPGKYKNTVLVALDTGSHVGFIDMAPALFRWLNNPDRIGCVGLMYGLKKAQEGSAGGKPLPNLGELLGGPPGIDAKLGTAPCKSGEYPRAMRPARQHTLTTLAVYSFLESLFSPAEITRAEMHAYLFEQFSKENKDVTVIVGN